MAKLVKILEKNESYNLVLFFFAKKILHSKLIIIGSSNLHLSTYERSGQPIKLNQAITII